MESKSIASCQQRYSEISINSTVLLSILFGIFQIIFIKDTVHCEIKAHFQKCIVSIKSTVQNLCIYYARGHGFLKILLDLLKLNHGPKRSEQISYP